MASAKKSFVLRLDESTYKALERWASDEFRSVNGQMEWIIAQALKQHGRLPVGNAIGDTPSGDEAERDEA